MTRTPPAGLLPNSRLRPHGRLIRSWGGVVTLALALPAGALLGIASPRAGLATESPLDLRRGRELFETTIRPLFSRHCIECHGSAKARSGLDLSTRETLLTGGDHGPSVVPGAPDASPVLEYLRHRAEPFMPPERPPLPETAIEALADWIRLGAPYGSRLGTAGPSPAGSGDPLAGLPDAELPAGSLASDASAVSVVSDGSKTSDTPWAFAPLANHPDGTTLDGLVATGWAERGATPAPEVPKAVLARRLHFDTIGLPPAPDDLAAFLADDSPGAYEALVDRLLASPHFGERWARHWLDVARFAESHGFEHDYDRAGAFHYRDFVIRAFNADMPFDRFVRWQLAGDELAPENSLALVATGFLAAGVYPTQLTLADAERIRYDAMDDMLATTGVALLATTIGCARCHDHKYDPISADEYYAMLSAFTTTIRSEIAVDLPAGPVPAASVAADPGDLDGASPGAPGTRAPTRILIASEGPHLRPLPLHKSNRSIPDFYPATYRLQNGDPASKLGEARLGFLSGLTRSPNLGPWRAPSADARTSGRRAALARWITDTEAGAGHLLARVIVNRVWQHYFGRGIVATPNDFGAQGARPTHPELLDFLARQLIDSGWRLKPIHKLVLMSRLYRLGPHPDRPGPGSSSEPEAGREAESDPDHAHLCHRHPRRLEAEAIRDAALAVSGLLDRSLYGPGTLDEAGRRRSLYFTVKRSRLVPSMQILGWPDTLTSLGHRTVTTSPSQALLMLNHPAFRGMARGFAERIAASADVIGTAFLTAFSRPPSARERALAEDFLGGAGGDEIPDALVDFCAALLASNEFVYVD